MITFTLLLIALIVVAIISIISIIIGGAGFIALFGDVIICGLIIWLLVKLFRRRK